VTDLREILKLDGGVRLVGIPTVRDRFIQQAIGQVLTRMYDPTFPDNSYYPEEIKWEVIKLKEKGISNGVIMEQLDIKNAS
jgi:hypothetical protein